MNAKGIKSQIKEGLRLTDLPKMQRQDFPVKLSPSLMLEPSLQKGSLFSPKMF
jgi:hypothetical protein